MGWWRGTQPLGSVPLMGDTCPHGCPMDRGVHRPQCQLYGPRPDTLLGIPDGQVVVVPDEDGESD